MKVKLDPENTTLLFKSGVKLYIDNTYEPEKHVVLVGTVEALPQQLSYSDRGDKLPWITQMELQIGDRVVMHYLGVFNCISNERRHFIKEGENTWIFIKYQLIYAVIREGTIIPVNGYILVEPSEDPEKVRLQNQARESGIELVDFNEKTRTHVNYGKVAYVGKPNTLYYEKRKCDDDVDVSPGDLVILKKVRDIPVEYEYHAKLDGGRKLYRVQRHDILATL